MRFRIFARLPRLLGQKNKPPLRVVTAYNESSTLGVLLLPSCMEQPEGSISSVAFFVFMQRASGDAMMTAAVIVLVVLAFAVVALVCVTNDKSRRDGASTVD